MFIIPKNRVKTRANKKRATFIQGIDRQTDEIALKMELEFGQKNLITDAKDLTPWNALYRKPVGELDKDYVAYR